MKLFSIAMGLGLIGSLGIVWGALLAKGMQENHVIADITICESRIC